jgi:hypothetical protein
MRRILPGLGLLLCLASAAWAAPALAAADGRHRDCTCRAPGKRVHVGESLCLATPDGPRLATCTMNQNITSWAISREGCVVSLLDGRRDPVE